MQTLLLFTTALLGMLFSGCTVIGIVAGASVDHRNARAHRVSWDSVSSVPRGRDVEVTLMSGDTLRGKFTGMRALPADSYRCAYDSARIVLAGDSVLPALGETMHLVLATGRRIDGPFRGLDGEALAVYHPLDQYIEYVSMPTIARLRNADGRSFDVDRLRALASRRSLPSARKFVVESRQQTSGIPLQYIHEVYALPHHTHYWILGGAIGLGVDAVVAYAVVLSLWPMHFPKYGSSGGYGSGY